LAVCCLIFKWRLLLATIVGLTGLAWLINYTVEQGTEVSEGLQSNSMIFFIGGGVAIVFLMLYLVFIKEECRSRRRIFTPWMIIIHRVNQEREPAVRFSVAATQTHILNC
jgi:hypothetical protein